MKKYTLKMPEKNVWLIEKNVWYVGVAESDMYLRPSGKVLQYTGHGTDDSGYWNTYEEALEAKEAYEKQFTEYPIVVQYIGEGLGQYDIVELQNEKLGIIVGSRDEYWIGKEMQIESLANCIEIKLQKTNQSDDMVDAVSYIFHSGNTDENESGCLKPSKFFTNDVLKQFKKHGMLKSKSDKIDKQWDKLVEESNRGDGGSTSYYKLPENATELGELIYHKNMNHSIGEAFCALYRLEDNGERKRNLRKVQYYIEQELSRC